MSEGGDKEDGRLTVLLAPLSEGLPLVLGGYVEDVTNEGPAAGAGWVGEPSPRPNEAVDEEEEDGKCDEQLEGNQGGHCGRSRSELAASVPLFERNAVVHIAVAKRRPIGYLDTHKACTSGHDWGYVYSSSSSVEDVALLYQLCE